MRVLVLSPGHPEHLAGGTEAAAYALFEHLRANRTIESVVFAAVGATADAAAGAASLRRFRRRPDEYVFAAPKVDGFSFGTTDIVALRETIEALIDLTRPDIVHIHHFYNIGIEIFELFEKRRIKIVLTVHEFLLICNLNGQMMKASGILCREETTRECSYCFPQFTPDQFLMRKTIISDYIKAVSLIISPSAFVAERLRAWGHAEPIRIEVVENPLSLSKLAEIEATQLADTGPRRRAALPVNIGFFGRVTPYKGILPFLKAVELLPEDLRRRVHVAVHGDLAHQSQEFSADVLATLDRLGDCATFAGAYRHAEVIGLMRQYDWVTVPSVWWENSPVVIQEALACGVPVLSSRIGGMAEKVEEGVNGHLFLPGALADIRRVIEQVILGESPVGRVDPGIAIGRAHAAAAQIAQLYGALR